MAPTLRRVLAAAALGAWLAAGPAARADDASDALAAAARGDWTTALARSEAAVGDPRAGVGAWIARAWVLSASGRKEEAAEAYGRATEIDPRDALAPTNRASVLLALGRDGEALAAADEAVRRDPARARAHNHRGVALERLGRLDEARAAYRAAIRLAPRDPVPYNNLGALAFRRGVEGAASAHFAKALELDPSFQAAAVNASLVLSVAEDAEVLARGEEAVLAAGARPGADARARARARGVFGDRAARAGRWAEAKARYLEQLDIDPDDAAALNNLGVAEDQMGEAREALTHLQAALSLRPEDVNLRNNVGVVHVHRGDWASAEAVFREILREDPRFHRGWHNLGVVLGARGDRAGATAALRNAAVLAPQDASSAYNLAVLARDAGAPPAEEKAAYERALALDPGLAEAHLALGALLADPATPAALRDEARARAHLLRFLAVVHPDDAAGRKQAQDWLVWLDRRPRDGPRTP